MGWHGWKGGRMCALAGSVGALNLACTWPLRRAAVCEHHCGVLPPPCPTILQEASAARGGGGAITAREPPAAEGATQGAASGSAAAAGRSKCSGGPARACAVACGAIERSLCRL